MANSNNAKKGKVISLSNQKGGAGKTTSTAALATIFGERGYKVLAVDNDPQANLSLQFGIDPAKNQNLPGTIEDLYELGNKSKTPKNLAIPTGIENVDIIVSSVFAAELELILPAKAGSDLLLATTLKPYRQKYDLIFVDSPPNLGKFVINVLNSSDYFIIPVEGSWGLRSVNVILKLAAQNAEVYNLPTQFLGVFITMAERTTITQLLAEEALQRFPDNFFQTKIRRATIAREAAALGKPVPIYAADSALAADYKALADEISQRIGLK